MKKLSVTVAAILLLTLTAFALTACADDENVFAAGDSVTVAIAGDPDFETVIDLEGTERGINLTQLLDIAGIEYEIVDGFLTSVGDLAPEPPEYIYLYTSVESDFDTSEYAETMTFGDTELCSSGVGANDISIVPGAIIYIGTITSPIDFFK